MCSLPRRWSRTCTGAVVNSLQRQWRTRCCERGLRAFITRDESLVSSWEETRADLLSIRHTEKPQQVHLKTAETLQPEDSVVHKHKCRSRSHESNMVWGFCCQSTNGLIHPARFDCTLDFCGKQVMLSSNAQKRTFPSGTLALKVPWSALKHAALFYVVR